MIVGLSRRLRHPRLEESEGGRLKREAGKVIGRVVVGRAIRIGGGGARAAIDGALAGLPEAPVRRPSTHGDLRCSSCDAVVCEGSRVKLFAGIVLQCTGCGHPNRVAR